MSVTDIYPGAWTPIEQRALLSGLELTLPLITNLDLRSKGFTNLEAAKSRRVEIETVKTQNKKSFENLGATNIYHAVRLAIELGYIEVIKDNTVDWQKLWPAEIKALEMASLGFGIYETAATRHVGSGTIKSQRKSIIRKLDASNMANAVRIAFEVGIFDYPVPRDGVSAAQIGALIIENEARIAAVHDQQLAA